MIQNIETSLPRSEETEPVEIIQSASDEKLMRSTLLKCYGSKAHAFRVSVEHYRYLAEQIVSLREHIKRAFPTGAAPMTERLTDEIVALQDDCEIYRAQRDEAWDTIAALLAKVARLEAALKIIAERAPGIWAKEEARDALKDAPQ